jgi:hypothetical protein
MPGELWYSDVKFVRNGVLVIDSFAISGEDPLFGIGTFIGATVPVVIVLMMARYIVPDEVLLDTLLMKGRSGKKNE